jgi:hypothetical protein
MINAVSHCFPLPHHGHMFLPPRPHRVNCLVKKHGEHLLVQEHQGIHGLILVRWRRSLCHGQMGQECSNLSCAILEILPVDDCVIVRMRILGRRSPSLQFLCQSIWVHCLNGGFSGCVYPLEVHVAHRSHQVLQASEETCIDGIILPYWAHFAPAT